LNKLRKGDGNDVTPNPTKLYQLGKQIRDLSGVGSTPSSSSVSFLNGLYLFDNNTADNNNSSSSAMTATPNDSNEVKKEKNKVASRACRLRKKAQHEANKLKLHGLNEEHKQLVDVISSMKLIILKRFNDGQLSSSQSNHTLESILEQLIATKYNIYVAGSTDGFVETIIRDMENVYTSKRNNNNNNNNNNNTNNNT